MRTRVKICGITRTQDASTASSLGVDALGLVFFPASSRLITVAAGIEIAHACGPFVTRVGLFLDPELAEVQRIVEQVPLDVLQFHGDESPLECASFGLPYIKSVPVRSGFDTAEYARRYPDAQAFLLDSHELGKAGGTGRAFDWNLVPANLNRPMILAGGLGPSNVAEAIAKTRPWAVDVSSGVESAKGIKDADKMTAFVNEVADCQR